MFANYCSGLIEMFVNPKRNFCYGVSTVITFNIFFLDSITDTMVCPLWNFASATQTQLASLLFEPSH